MSGNANVTISIPGQPNWHMLWGNGGFDNFQLDIVGFLAVLGESSVTANAQVSALSTLFYLPRLIPAPQALLWPSRPTQLEPTKAKVAGVESGILKEHVHHVAHILLGDNMPKFAVRCVKVTKSKQDYAQNWKDRIFRGEQKQKRAKGDKSDKLSPPQSTSPVIKAKANGPTSWVTLLSFFLSVALFIISICLGDGMSLIATLLLSLLSTLIGVVNKWSLKLPQRPVGATISPPVQVVIRYPNGSFLVVKCDEAVARELYFAPEEIEYNVKSEAIYRLISLAGTLMLMGGVITLANAKLQLQFAWAGAYIITNAAHFIAAAVPPKMHWDLSCYRLKEQSVVGGPNSETFTEALWKAVIFTKSTDWIKNAEAAPRTKVWDQWLEETEVMARMYKSHQGTLIEPNPIWFNKDQDPKHQVTGTIWDVPADWQPKEEWDRISRGYQTESQEPMSPTSTLGDGF